MPLLTPLKRWLARYGLAELVGTAFAVIAALGAHAVTNSEVAVSYAGALAETLGYYGIICSRDIAVAARAKRASGERFGARDLTAVLREIVIEFGPAEVVDSLFVRPLMMGIGMHWLGAGLGALAGKLAADLLFYLPVIATYEARRPRRPSSSRPS